MFSTKYDPGEELYCGRIILKIRKSVCVIGTFLRGKDEVEDLTLLKILGRFMRPPENLDAPIFQCSYLLRKVYACTVRTLHAECYASGLVSPETNLPRYPTCVPSGRRQFRS